MLSFLYVDNYDSNNSGAVTGAVVAVFCVIIIIMVITNIMIWIYCFRKNYHTGILYLHTYIHP